MFKSARWRSEKNKVKIVFKLQFHAAKVPQIGGDALMISVVPADVGKPTVKSDRALVRDGSCFWDNPVYETVKFSREPKSGKIHERIYYRAHSGAIEPAASLARGERSRRRSVGCRRMQVDRRVKKHARRFVLEKAQEFLSNLLVRGECKNRLDYSILTKYFTVSRNSIATKQ